MNPKKLLALSVLLVVLPSSAALGAGGSRVTVRVEGLQNTLLAPALVRVSSGWITQYGAPTGKCPAASAQGALDVATRHNWRGTWTTQFGPEYEITSIFGEAHSFSSKYFWEIFTDNVAASSGACQLKLHPGEQLLFAAVPQTGPTVYPLAIEAPRSASRGHTFTVKVVFFNASGKAKPVAGATVSVAGRSGRTGSRGTVPLTPDHAGRFVLRADHPGYIRAAPVTVTVS